MMSKDANLTITVDDVKECKKFSRTANPFAVLARSLAPSIHGHDYIKKAVLSLLLGGVEKILPNGTRLRGDINVLLIGDPSVAKSQMLRYVSNVAPRVIMTTGRGSSGVGLTAAVTTDMETGERRLEAGAMVLADRGIVCIDEFDKMSDADRTAIHEVMEQGRVSIAKAGIHARLNARTAVLAAANPVYGRYDEYKSPMDNIGLQDSLLSRFDLLFIVLDQAEPELDRCIADHVLRMHRYRNPAEQDGEATPLFQIDMTLSTNNPDEEKRNAEKTLTYEKHDPTLYGKGRGRKDKILSMEFMKKYIHIAKCIKPQLSSEASATIADEYTRLRSLHMNDGHMARTQPITARSLETMIRLSTAHARARMSKVVTEEDAQSAIELVQFAYFKRVLEKDKKRRREHEDPESDDNEEQSEPEDVGQASQASNGSRKSKRVRKEPANGTGDSADPYDVNSMSDNDDENETLIALRRKAKQKTTDEADTEPMDLDEQETSSISDERLALFKTRLSALFTNEREESLSIDKINEWMTGQGFTLSETKAGLDKMTVENKLMVAEGFVFLF